MKLRDIVAFSGLVLVVGILVSPVAGVKSDNMAIMMQPLQAQSDTFGIIAADTLSRAIDVRFARNFSLYVPTITTAALTMLGGYDTDSTFTIVQAHSDAGDSLIALAIHSGTGNVTVDLTSWIVGLAYVKFDVSVAAAALQTFHYTIKY